jgi:hypothetical protein
MVILYILGSVYLAGSVATFLMAYALDTDCIGSLNAAWRWPHMVFTAFKK